MARVRRLVLVLVCLVGAYDVPLVAQEQVGEFRPLQPGDLQEQIPAPGLVYGAYAFVWVTFVVYLFLLWQRMKRVEAELADVRAKLGGQRR